MSFFKQIVDITVTFFALVITAVLLYFISLAYLDNDTFMQIVNGGADAYYDFNETLFNKFNS